MGRSPLYCNSVYVNIVINKNFLFIIKKYVDEYHHDFFWRSFQQQQNSIYCGHATNIEKTNFHSSLTNIFGFMGKQKQKFYPPIYAW